MNAPTMIIAGVVLAVFVSIIVHGIRKRRKGGGGCSCGCEGCPSSGACHPKR